MNQKDLDLINAAAGLPKRKKRRKPRVKLELHTPEQAHLQKLMACQEVLDSLGGHRSKSARILKIHVRTLYKWIQEIKDLKARSKTHYEEAREQ